MFELLTEIEGAKTAFVVKFDEFNVVGGNGTDVIWYDVLTNQWSYSEGTFGIIRSYNTVSISVCDPSSVYKFIFVELVIDIWKSEVAFKIVGVREDLVWRLIRQIRGYVGTSRYELT